MERRSGITGAAFFAAAIGLFVALLAAGVSGTAVWAAPIPLAIVGIVMLVLSWRLGPVVWDARPARLAAWLPGSATILATGSTGVGTGGGPHVPATHNIVRLRLRVCPDGGTPYENEHTQRVAVGLLGALVPAAVVPVRIDPADRRRVAVMVAAPARRRFPVWALTIGASAVLVALSVGRSCAAR